MYYHGYELISILSFSREYLQLLYNRKYEIEDSKTILTLLF